MEEITLELDDELVQWLEHESSTRKMSVSEVVAEVIRELRELQRSDAAREQSPG